MLRDAYLKGNGAANPSLISSQLARDQGRTRDATLRTQLRLPSAEFFEHTGAANAQNRRAIEQSQV